ncbi:hypothetical protein KFE98_21200 [bacterium SCSIO 12741]|nr:hypothetical protein KFE98_21200 [bacterium SCSIO 12741]
MSGNRTLAVLVFVGFVSNMVMAQNTQLSSIHPTGHKPKSKKVRPLNFPVIETGDSAVDANINQHLKKDFLGVDSVEIDLQQALDTWIDGVDFLDYEVTYDQYGLLSLLISAEGCGAYCTSWSEPYVFSTYSGKEVELYDFMDTTRFIPFLREQVNNRYTFARYTIKHYLGDSLTGVDTTDYEWALEVYEQCQKDFYPDDFLLYDDRIEILAPCPMPNAIKTLTPLVDLSYSRYDLSPYLKYRTGPDSPLFMMDKP